MARPTTIAVFTKNRVNPAYAAARLAADRVAAETGARTVHYVPQTPDHVGQQKALVGQALTCRTRGVRRSMTCRWWRTQRGRCGHSRRDLYQPHGPGGS